MEIIVPMFLVVIVIAAMGLFLEVKAQCRCCGEVQRQNILFGWIFSSDFQTLHNECSDKLDATVDVYAQRIAKGEDAADWKETFAAIAPQFKDFAPIELVLSKALVDCLDDSKLNNEKFTAISDFVNKNEIPQEIIRDTDGAYTKFVQAQVLCRLRENSEDLIEFHFPRTPFAFVKSERQIWVSTDVGYLEHKRRTRRAGSSQGSSVRVAKGLSVSQRSFSSEPIEYTELVQRAWGGTLCLTTKHLYYHSSEQSFRISLNKIVSIDLRRGGLFSLDSIVLTRDRANALPEVFQVGADACFFTNAINALGDAGQNFSGSRPGEGAQSVQEPMDPLTEIQVLATPERARPAKIAEKGPGSQRHPEYDTWIHAFKLVFDVNGRPWGQTNQPHRFGLFDDAKGVQWNLIVDTGTDSVRLGVNLEGLKYKDWPIRSLILAEMREPLLIELANAVSGPEGVQVHFRRDAWQVASRPVINEVDLGATPALLSSLTLESWRDTLDDALSCLDSMQDHRARARVRVTRAATPKRPETQDVMEVSPHLMIMAELDRSVPAIEAIRGMRDRLAPIHEWMQNRAGEV